MPLDENANVRRGLHDNRGVLAVGMLEMLLPSFIRILQATSPGNGPGTLNPTC